MTEKIKDNNLKQFLNELKKLKEVNPDPIFEENARIRLLSKISKPKVQEKYTFMYRFAFLILLLLLLPGIGVAYAAQSSLPGDPLYQVKIASEKIVLTIAPVKLKTYINAEIIKRRENEQKKLQKKIKIKEVEKLKNENSKDKSVQPTPQISKSVEVLQDVIEKAPDQAIKGLEKAIESVNKHIERKKARSLPTSPKRPNH